MDPRPPKECPKPVRPDLGSAGPGAENGSRKRKNRKKHHHRPRSELKVTNHGEGKDSPVWSQGGPGSSSESSAFGVDSGFSSTQKWQGVNTTRATVVQGDQTQLLSPATIKKLDATDYDDDDPLSDCPDYKPNDDDQEMAIVEEQPGTIIGDAETGSKETGMGKKDTGRNLGDPVDAQDPILPSTSAQQPGPTRPSTGALASAEAVEMQALTSPALAITMAQIQEATATGVDNDDTDEEKARLDACKGVMQGLHKASHTLSEGYQWACLEVQGLVNQSLSLSTEKDRRFMAEASTALCQWVKAVQLAIDCLRKSVAEQFHLLEDAWKVGMEIMKEILALYPLEGKKEPADPLHDLMIRAFNAAQKHIEEAFLCLHHKLPVLVHQHVPPVQAIVFLATIFQIMCTYWQEMDNMVLSQTVMPAQVIPNMWGVWQGVIQG